MSSDKPVCKFGSLCYRKNPDHFEEYSHPEKKATNKRKPASEEEGKTEKPKKRKPISDEEGEKEKPKIRNQRDISDDEGEKDEPKKGEEQLKGGDDSGDVGASTSASRSSSLLDISDARRVIKEKFLVDMPEDFYEFWKFAQSLDQNNPSSALFAATGLRLVGPFDVLSGSVDLQMDSEKFLRHWRYYYDPPELLTVIRGDDKQQFHMGYYRDDPKDMPSFVASNAAKENCLLTARGGNLFAAVYWFIETLEKKNKTKQLANLKDKLATWAESNGCELEQKTAAMKARDKKVVSKTFHCAGIVVPVDANEVGYRPLPETPGDLKKMLQKIVDCKTEEERTKAFDPLTEIITYIQFANDECDFGEGLELGIDLFSFGSEVFHSTILSVLPLAYELLNRPQFGEIVKAHLTDRRHTANLSQC